jgi:2-dehydropantoate 2-reductase
MQFAVIGAGNLGSVYGGNLARIGEQVTFIDIWQEHIQRIREQGLEVSNKNGAYTVRAGATTDPREAPQADVAIICVNAYSTSAAAETAALVLKKSGYVLTLQNGVGNIEILIDRLGADRVMAGLSFHSGDIQSPGRVSHTNSGSTFMGELNRSRTDRLGQLVEVMQNASLNPVIVDDIVVTIWSKFVHNCGINAICAIAGLRPGHIQEIPELDDFQARVIGETVALVRAKGIQLPDDDPVRTIKEYCANKFHRVSMLQHLDRGQMTEIDALNGYVAAESARLGLPAPCNDALTRLMKGRQHSSFVSKGHR